MYNFKTNILHYVLINMLIREIVSAGSGPVLIKMAGDKKGNKKGGGNLILISGGKCGGPTLIKGGGGGKKGGGEQMILVGGQGNCEEKKQVHVVKQIVPVPYYIPKPVYKYILRHHYVPVRQYIMKPVPVPYPMKSYSKSSYGGSHDSGYGSGGGSTYSSDSSSNYGSSSSYDSDSSSSKYGGGYGNGNDGSGSSESYGMNYDDPNGNGGSNGNGQMTAGYQRQSYDSTPYPVQQQQSMMMDNQQGVDVGSNGGRSNNDYQNGLTHGHSSMGPYKAAATNSYYFESPTSSYGQSYSSASEYPSSSMNNPLYAPVYSGPNGRYYTTNQMFNDTNGGSTTNLISPSTSSSTYGTISVQPTAIESDSNASHLTGVSSSSSTSSSHTSSIHSSPNDFLRLQPHSTYDRSSAFSSKKIRSKSAKMDLERTKKLLIDSFSPLGLNE